MDSEQELMPKMLHKKLLEAFSIANPQYKINITQAELDPQKYNNCGLEVIENFMAYLTGDRLSQEDALPIHSALLEDQLLEIDPKIKESATTSIEFSKDSELFYKLADIYGADKVLELTSQMPPELLYAAIESENFG